MDIQSDVMAYLKRIRRGFFTIGDKIAAKAAVVDPNKVVGWATRYAANESGEGLLFLCDVKHVMLDTCKTSKVMYL